MAERLKLLGSAWIVWSAITALCGFGLGTWAGHDGWLGTLGLAFASVLVVIGAVGIVVGAGLRRGWEWAMSASRVVAMIHIVNPPFGLALGLWTLVTIDRARRQPPAVAPRVYRMRKRGEDEGDSDMDSEARPTLPTLDEMRACLRAGMSRDEFFSVLDDITTTRGLRLGGTPDVVRLPVAEGDEFLCFVSDELTYVEYRGDVFMEIED